MSELGKKPSQRTLVDPIRDSDIVEITRPSGSAYLDRAATAATLRGGIVRSGRVFTDLMDEEGDDDIVVVSLQSDGRIIASGFTDYFMGIRYFSIGRYSADGVFDATFAGGRGCAMPIFNAGQEEFVTAAAVQSDDKIIAVGYSDNGDGTTDLAVCRLDEDGVLDPTYGTGGKKLIASGVGGLSGYLFPYECKLDADGKLLIAGGDDNGAFLLRLTTAGALDTSFGGGDGVVLRTQGSIEWFDNVAVQSDGKIVVIGKYGSGGVTTELVRYTSAGAIDTAGFGTSGVAAITMTGYSAGGGQAGLGFQANGKIIAAVAAIKSADSKLYVRIFRYTTAGVLDTTFGTSGTTDAGPDTLRLPQNTQKLQIDADDCILVNGVMTALSPAEGSLVVGCTKFLANGKIDAAFGYGGQARAYVGGLQSTTGGYCPDIVLTADRKILVGGWATRNRADTTDHDWVLVQWNRYGEIDKTFGDAE